MLDYRVCVYQGIYSNLGIILELCLLQETRQHCLQPGDSFQSKSNVSVSLLQRPTSITGVLLRSSWSHRRLKQSSKDNNNTIAWGHYFERMDCHFSRCRIYLRSFHIALCPRMGLKTKWWKQGWLHLQLLPVMHRVFCASHSCNTWLCTIDILSPHVTHSCRRIQ